MGRKPSRWNDPGPPVLLTFLFKSNPTKTEVKPEENIVTSQWAAAQETKNEVNTMLVAYEEIGCFRIKDLPLDDPRVDPFPTQTLADAERILVEARRQMPKDNWVIEEQGAPHGGAQGPYRVCSKTFPYSKR